MSRHQPDLPSKVIFWGGTGQAKVMRPVYEHYGCSLEAVIDDTPGLEPPFEDVPLYEGYEGFQSWREEHGTEDTGFCIAIGNPHGRVRLKLHDLLVDEGLHPTTIIHPSAIVAPNASIGAGCQIHAGAVIMPEAQVGRQCIINTKASVDHECVLKAGVEIAPGATLCGSVQVGAGGWVCAGATVLPRVRIGADAVLGAGAVATQDIPPGVTAVGIPARPTNHKEDRS